AAAWRHLPDVGPGRGVEIAGLVELELPDRLGRARADALGVVGERAVARELHHFRLARERDVHVAVAVEDDPGRRVEPAFEELRLSRSWNGDDPTGAGFLRIAEICHVEVPVGTEAQSPRREEPAVDQRDRRTTPCGHL